MKRGLQVIKAGVPFAVLLATWAGPVQADQDKPMVVVGQSGRVEAGQAVEGAIVIGGDLEVAGRVEGPAIAVGGHLRVESGASIDGPAAAIGGDLQVQPTARIEGPRVQVAAGDFSRVVADLAQAVEGAEPPPLFWGSVVRMFQVLGVFVIAVFLVTLAPRQVQAVQITIRSRPAHTSLAGLVLMLGFIPFCVLLAISVVGLPLIPFAVLLLWAACAMGLTGLAVAIGFRVPVVKGRDNLFGAMTAGLLLVLLVAVIPVLGAIALFCAAFYGAGAVALSRFGTRTPKEASGSVTDRRAEAAGTSVKAHGS